MLIRPMERVLIVNQFISKGDMEMLRHLSKGFSVVICLLVLAFSTSAKADVVYSTFGSGMSYGGDDC